MELRKSVKNYLEYLEVERGLADRTIANYKDYLDRLTSFLGTEANTQDLTLEQVTTFRHYLNGGVEGLETLVAKKDKMVKYTIEEKKGLNLSVKTQNYHLIAIRGLVKYMVRNNIDCPLSPDQIELISEKYTKEKVRCLSKNQLGEMLNIPPKNKVAIRNKAILELLFSTGMRVSELHQLQIDDINMEKKSFAVKGKGGKIRLVFLSENAKKALEKYIETMDWAQKKLFRVSIRTIQDMVEKRGDYCGVPFKVSPHVIRHTFATNLLENGADIRSIQKMLGHKSITTTEQYLHVSDKHLEDTFDKFHG